MLNREDSPIWRALADPTRRLQLDLLRERPRTTGELCEYFKNMSRIGVMKHLGILEKAGLIIVKRQGKFRWNYLNAVPIQTIYERWVKSYEVHWATSALTLKNYVENSGGNKMSDLKTFQVELEIKINAPQKRVWLAIINDTGKWWLQDFHAIANSEVILEPKVGGRLYEKSKDGSEGLWYMVTGFYPERSIEFTGHLRPEFGGPATTLLKLALTEKNGVTKLQISDSVFGDVDENMHKNIDGGWRQLFEDGLKAYVEKGRKAL